MMLSVEGMVPVLLGGSSAPFPFPGDAKTEAVLQQGPITDLNVMTRRGHFSHRVTRRVEAGEIRFLTDAALVIVVVTGHAKIAQVELDPLDAMILENATDCGGLRIETLEPYFVIEIVALAND